MELWGIGVDMEKCLHQRHILIRKLKELEKEAYRLAGITFSLYNAAAIANVLYTHLKLPIPKECAKGKLHPSTAKHSLDQLRYLFSKRDFIFLLSYTVVSFLEIVIDNFLYHNFNKIVCCFCILFVN